MIFTIAYRNIVRKKKHSLTIFLLFTLLIALFFIGNALIAESGEGLKRSYRDNFTADLVIRAPGTMDVSLFGALTPSFEEFYTMPVLEGVDQILSVVNETGAIRDWTGLSQGAALMEMKGQRIPTPLFAVDGEDYFSLFQDINILEGAGLKAGEPGVMLPRVLADRIIDAGGQTIQIGDPVLLSMGGTRGFKIREVPLTGIFSYDTRDPQLERIVLCDSQTLQALNSLALAGSNSHEITEDEMEFLDEDLDLLFSEDLFVETEEDEQVSVETVVGMRDDTDNMAYAPDKWHFILLKLAEGVNLKSFSAELQQTLDEAGAEVVIMDWRQAAGLSARMVFLLQILYNAGFSLIFLAGGIAIVNILLISVFDRYSELGTLRAIGADKICVSALVLLENLFLAVTGGITGIALAALLLNRINSLNIGINNILVQTLFGMTELHIGFHLNWALGSLLVSLVLGVLASWIPLVKVNSIAPTAAQEKH